MTELPTDDFFENFQEIKNSLLSQTSKLILKSTVQFFYDNEKKEPSADASGLLISLCDRHFMVTAAHVIAENYNTIYLILPDKELQLGGILHVTPLPDSKNRIGDKIDIAVMELEDTVVADLKNSFEFINTNNIGIGHQISNLPYYLSVGYPANQTKKIYGEQRIVAKPFIYQSEPEPQFNFHKFGFTPNIHIAIKFDGKITSESNKSIHKSGPVKGISGGGLWYLKNFATKEMVNDYQLVGLIIDQRSKRPDNAIIATKIDLVTEFIRQHFKLNIPKSKIIKVNLL